MFFCLLTCEMYIIFHRFKGSADRCGNERMINVNEGHFPDHILLITSYSLRKFARTIYSDFLNLKAMKIFSRNFSYFCSKHRLWVHVITACIPQFFYIKVGFKGVYIARTCVPDVTSHYRTEMMRDTLLLGPSQQFFSHFGKEPRLPEY